MTSPIHIDTSGILRNFLQVQKAVMLANELLSSTEFYDRIAASQNFDMADVPPETIAELMLDCRIQMHLDLYYALSPVKNYDGYDDLDDPSTIHLNTWKIDRSPASICNTIIHSCIHAVNAKNPQYYFGHGDMTRQGKEHTAPYYIGALAQQMASEDGSAIVLPLEHDAYEPHVKNIRMSFARSA